LVVGSVVTVPALLLASAGAADAAPFGCYSGNQYTCATVTAISPGSSLRMHRQPNYTGGVVPGSPAFHNGDWVILDCWTTGAGDADGHGDRYWFRTFDSGYFGYVNDWYLTTGSPSQWMPLVSHC
jgi:hypothetical protein